MAKSIRELKKFMVAVVLSGTVEAKDPVDAEGKLEYALGLLDFIEGLQITKKIREV